MIDNPGIQRYVIEIRQTVSFRKWFDGVRDGRPKARIIRRIERAEAGNLGDVKYFNGIGEMRVDYGPGYRLYFVARGTVLVILLCGGDKRSQRRDIADAKAMARELE